MLGGKVLLEDQGPQEAGEMGATLQPSSRARSRLSETAPAERTLHRLGFLCRLLLNPDIQKRLSRDAALCGDAAQLLRKLTLKHIVRRRRADVDIELCRLRLVPVIGQVMGVPELA